MADISILQKMKANEFAAAQNPYKSAMPPMSKGPVGPEDLAANLGIKPAPALGPVDELVRLNRIVYMKHANSRFSYEDTEPVVSKFCAVYLPAIFEKFINPPPLPSHVQKEMMINNAYFEALSLVQHSAYFYKYLRSTKPAAKYSATITKIYAGRFLDIAPEWDAWFENPPPQRPAVYFTNATHNMLDLLETFLTANIKTIDEEDVLPSEIRQKLVPFLTKWAQKYQGEYLGTIAHRIFGVLAGDAASNKATREVRKRMNGWEECGLERCRKTDNLKACARCQTVRYCSPAHQKEDWNKPGFRHKDHCYQTEF